MQAHISKYKMFREIEKLFQRKFENKVLMKIKINSYVTYALRSILSEHFAHFTHIKK